MKITFDNNHSLKNVDKVTTKNTGVGSKKTEKANAFALDISGMVKDNTAYGVHGWTTEDVMQAADNQDVTLLRNYMTVMSNSMSEEDFARLQKEGYSPTDTDIDTMVTIVDKIKAEMAKAGVEVIGYTDTLDSDTLTEIAGSESYAKAISDAMHKADVPVNNKNVEAAVAAARKAENLAEPSEGTVRYMLDNDLEPTIDNFYMAEHSGANYTSGNEKRNEDINIEELRKQIEKVITQAGFEISEAILKDVEFIIKKGIPLTVDTLQLMEEIKQTKLPVKGEEVFEAIAGALAEGKQAEEANLYDGRSCYQKAADIDNDINRLLEEAKRENNVTQRRQLEEVRLRMTVEANVKLLKSGFSIDTNKLEELVDALKEVENQRAKELFGSIDNAGENYELYKESVAKAAQIPWMPEAVVGKVVVKGTEESTINFIYEEGKALISAYDKAKESYETVMTSPRRDMGDNIQTAFRNIDSILEDMQMELSDENKRAVRILGYNSMEITGENILAVQKADFTVQNVVQKMTPAATVQMIRDGINPLETDMEELYNYLNSIETYDDEATKYSRYLYNLEQNKEITPEEKEAYIGIYRLLRQVEKTDGQAIGSLVKSNAEINFSNLLTAVRTGKIKGVDIAVNDELGYIEEQNKKGASISDQITKGYENIIQELKTYELPVSINNLLVMGMNQEGSAMKKLWEKAEPFEEDEQWENILTDKEDSLKTYETYLGEITKRIKAETFLTGISSVDVRSLQLMSKQLNIMAKAAKQEEYHIPIRVGDEITDIHLVLKHNNESKGAIHISMTDVSYGDITAEFIVEGDRIDGFLTGVTSEAANFLKNVGEIFKDSMSNQGWKLEKIPVIRGAKSLEMFKTKESNTEVETRELYTIAKMFIQVLKERCTYENKL